MRDKLLVFACFFIVLSCSEEDLPAGLYDYQVERLLSGQSGSKIWMQVVNSTDCSDSLSLYIDFVPNQSSDSIDLSWISPINNCSSYDTTLIGRAKASKLVGGMLFTDSLLFSNGSFWVVERITSDFLNIQRNGTQESYLYSAD